MNTDKIYAEQIANEYSEKETSKVKQLKKLDAKVKNPAYVFAYTFGIVCSLILGTGMSLAMGVIGGGTTMMFILGIIIGCFGILGVSVNYFIYKKILTTRKNHYKYDIMTIVKQITDAKDE